MSALIFVINIENNSDRRLEMAEFYIPDGRQIGKKEFIEYYNSRYYLSSEIVKGVNRAVNQNSKFIEDKIDDLLKLGIKDENDVVHILAWKTGKIKHKDSELNKKFEYYSSWSINEYKKDYKIKIYDKKDVDVKTFAEYIVKNITVLESESIDNPQNVLNKLKDKSPQGIGTVYLITLLYFISKGKYPIYDRFATMAVDAILNNKKPNDYVSYSELPNKNDKKFDEVINIYNKNYVNKLNEIFGDEYKSNRDIDRALWVYGHLFNNNKKGC